MRFLLDSSSIINLFNAGVLGLLCQFEAHNFSVSPMVVGECHGECAMQLIALRDEGCITFIDDSVVDADEYLSLLEAHGLGAGETECMAVAAVDDYGLCCDDWKARQAAANVIGEERVVGSLRLLQWCVQAFILDCEEAFSTFLLMKEAGGFLPDMPQAFFCVGDC